MAQRLIQPACLLLLAGLMTTSCTSPTPPTPRTQFFGFTRFDSFTREAKGETTVMISPMLSVEPWRELVLSWNADCPPSTSLKLEVRAADGEQQTPFYPVAHWSAEPGAGRTSSKKLADALATLDTDTLLCKSPMRQAQVRITLSGHHGLIPSLKFLGFSFLNPQLPARNDLTNRLAWSRELAVPERSQLGHPGGSGWCSPTCVSMLLGYWSDKLNRPELDQPVPVVAKQVDDRTYGGTGNWSFNMAYAGSFTGLRAEVRRLDGLHQVEDLLQANLPVALSVSFDLLNGKSEDKNDGHLVVVIGFTAHGDVIINDPWPDPKGINSLHKVVSRERLIRAWQRSKQTAYLIYPETVTAPAW